MEDWVAKELEGIKRLGERAPVPNVPTAEEAYANLMKAQGLSMDQSTSAARQILTRLLGPEMAGKVHVSPSATRISRSSLNSLVDQLGMWQGRFPNTVEGMKMLEGTIDPAALAHYRPVGGRIVTNAGHGYGWAMGIKPGPLGDIENASELNQRLGYLASRTGQSPVQSLWNHEFGHALDYSLDASLTPGLAGASPAHELAGVKLNTLKSQLLEDALRGRISGYAQESAINKMNKFALEGTQHVPGTATATAMDLRSAFHPQTINSFAKEPFAEAFAANPGMLNEVESAARAAGWRGAAGMGTMARGLGLGGALLAAPIIGEEVGKRMGGQAGKTVSWAGRGAGIGGLLGPEGALAGAGIGALASQLF